MDNIVKHYRPISGVSDELITSEGKVRSIWKGFLSHLSSLDEATIEARFESANQYLRDAGVYYRKYSAEGPAERDWPLSHIPVLIDQSEWDTICEGLTQRANLLEMFVSDVYGDNQLVKSGHLPGYLIGGNPAWIRAAHAIRPADGFHLNFIGFEIGRGPNGKWWILSDVTDTPMGAGFALENRVATSRAFPKFFSESHVHRLAGFFGDIQNTLFEDPNKTQGKVAMLTPGLSQDTYFEHAYLARYLGILLAEGEDLIVRDGQVMLRTVTGLQPIHTLWRRLASQELDPLETNAETDLGTPGLTEATRRGKLNLFNSLGSGILETRAFMAFLPQLSQTLLGEPLKMSNIATWWCGDAQARISIMENPDNLLLSQAFEREPILDQNDQEDLAGVLSSTSREALENYLDQRGQNLIAQESVTLSTTPAWHDNALTPRPLSLRLFLVRTQTGWSVMPGGYARIGASENAKAVAMQNGGSVADVWIISKEPVPRPTLISKESEPLFAFETQNEALLSRAADNLFWLGRYIERSEIYMRIFRAYFSQREAGLADDSTFLTYLRNQMLFSQRPDANELASLFSSPLTSALECARRVQDRFSVDGLSALKDLYDISSVTPWKMLPLDTLADTTSILLQKLSGLAGLIHENMYRSIGWRFLSLGLSLERAAATSSLLAALTSEFAPEGSLDMALELGDSTMTHRAQFGLSASRTSVLSLLGLDEANPRSILYHIARAQDHMTYLPSSKKDGRLSQEASMALNIFGQMKAGNPSLLTPQYLLDLRANVWTLSDRISSSYLK